MINKILKNKYLWLLCIEIILIVILVLGSKLLFYSDNVWHLLIVLIVSVLLVFCCFNGGICIWKKQKKVLDYFMAFFMIIGFCFGFIYVMRSVIAFRYENSYEVYLMSSNFSVREAKNNKLMIDNIFEKDFNNVFSRDIVIKNYYYDEEDNNYILYISDEKDNYRLKFLVEDDGRAINSIYWDYNGEKLYFLKDGKKSDNFEFYYAMYIIDEVLGENLDNVLGFEEVVEKKMEDYFDNDANNMVSYEKMSFDAKTNRFRLECQVASMDFYGDVLEKDFTITFSRKDNVLTKGVWYYGDSSFDYVDYKIKI